MSQGSQDQANGVSRKLWDRLLEDSFYVREYLWKYRKFVGIGLSALILVDALDVLPPIFLKWAVDAATGAAASSILLKVAIAYFVTTIIQGFCRYGWRMYLIRASMLAGRDLRGKFVHHLFGLASSFFDRRRIGDLMSLETSDTEAVRQAMGAGVLVFADSLFGFATVPVAMFWLSPRLALLSFIPLIFVPWVVMRNEREIHNRYEKVQESFGKLSALAQETLNGIRVVKAFAKEDVLNRRFRETGLEYLRLNMERARVQSSFGPFLDFIVSLGLVLLLYFGGDLVMSPTARGAVTLGTFIAFQRYIQKMVWPMTAFGMAVNTFQRSASSTRRLREVIAVQTDVPEAPSPRLPEGYPTEFTHRLRWKTRGEVEFRDLRFRFPGSQVDVLKGINLQIGSGERIAFVGAIGSGKSALLSLLPRLYPVDPGMAFVDGIDILQWPLRELRRQVGYVSQDVFLFSESVTENVAFGLHEWAPGWHDDKASYIPVIEEAARLSFVHEDMTGLPGAYQTRLGERGVNLSGGQKQRLTIARALAKEPPVLVLDDALSSVDVRTEEKILESLRRRPGRNTEIISAHRISTIQDADRIAVLECGELRQLGTHSELVRQKSGLYRRFYDQQRLKDDLERYATDLDPEGLSGPEVSAHE